MCTEFHKYLSSALGVIFHIKYEHLNWKMGITAIKITEMKNNRTCTTALDTDYVYYYRDFLKYLGQLKTHETVEGS